MGHCFCTGECEGPGGCPNSYDKIEAALRNWKANCDIRCVWEGMSPEEVNKPMGISCPCKKCSPWSM